MAASLPAKQTRGWQAHAPRIRTSGCRGMAGAASVAHANPPWKGSIMDKWRSVKNSTIIRVTTSVGTLVALAALAGAGWKWN